MLTFGVLGDLHYGRPNAIINKRDIFLPSSKNEVSGEGIKRRLKNFVERINLLPQIKFVLTVGDITESMCGWQAAGASEIMDDLNVPWLPIPGNHDIWPYERNSKGELLWNADKPITFGTFKNFLEKNSQTQKLFLATGENRTTGWQTFLLFTTILSLSLLISSAGKRHIGDCRVFLRGVNSILKRSNG